MASIVLLLYGFLFICCLMIIFFTKKRIKLIENNVYSANIIISFIGCIFEIVTAILFFSGYNVNSLLYNLLTRIIFIYYFLWPSLFLLYLVIICYDIKEKRKWFKWFYLFLILTSLLLFILPFNFALENNSIHPEGLCCYILYTHIFISLILMLILSIMNIRKIGFKKFFPIFLFFTMGTLALWIQSIYSSLFLTTPLITFITFITYFTIENPDIKMLNQVSAAKEAADKANQAKSDFLSSMSHEIRTPLNAIVGFSECIKNADSLEEAKENASDIVTASESLLEIVNGILDISKIESGKLELVQSDYDIYKILDEVVKLIKARLGEKPLNFEVNIAEDIPHVLYGDHFNIKKILINFLTNAVKYTDEGFIKFDVKCVKVNNDVCRLIMSVKDSGRGIKKEDIDKLFNKFQRLDEDKNTTIEGTGLGLAITKQLVEMMHGKIVVNSIYGEGSEFTVALDQRISNVVLETEETVVETELDLSGKKVLVVDDNKLNLKVAIKLLQPYKCTVETCESGFGCIDKITSGNKYDIILLDDMMPKMRGSETLTRLKSDPKFNIPVIALTANAIQGMREQYLLLGFDDYLAKPIERAELFRVLKKFVLKEDEPKIESKIEEHATIEESKDEVEIDYHDYTGKKVLIVDDNKLNIKVASKIMMSYHFDIDSVYSGVECLDKVKTAKYDIIFMDYMMPNMDGIETFNRLHEIPGFSTPVISLTADAVVGAREKFMEAGFNGYVSKPIDKKKLDEAINNALNNQ